MKTYIYFLAKKVPAKFLPSLAICGFIMGCATQPMTWKASSVAKNSSATVRLKANGQTLGTVDTATVKKLFEIKERIEKAANIYGVELLIASGDSPNAFSGPSKTGPVVGVNLAMIRLIGTDWDELAAVFGHEYAHIAQSHSGVRQMREQARQGASGTLGVRLGAAEVPKGGTIADELTATVTTASSRDDERDADSLGLRYMVIAGFDPHGAIRLWERMSAAGDEPLLPFLSNHPMRTERIENMKNLVASRNFITPISSMEQSSAKTAPRRVDESATKHIFTNPVASLKR
jgi:predicted Zn-dependent protease